MAETPPPLVDPRRRHPDRGRGGGGVRLLLAVALVVPLVACATKADVRDLQQEVRELSARQEALLRELQAAQRGQQDSIRVLGSRLSDNHIQLRRLVGGLQDQVTILHEYVGMSQQEIAALRDQMDRRTVPPPGPTQNRPTQEDGEARSIYEQAMIQFNRDALTSAQIGFEEVIDNWPGHELTPSARYYLADIHAQRGDIDAAIQEFLRIPEFHPDAERVPHALYRVGMLHVDRGENTEARSYLERVVNTWPDSPAADAARDALRELG